MNQKKKRKAILDLRKILSEKFTAATTSTASSIAPSGRGGGEIFRTGVDCLDAVGLRRGHLYEVIGESASSGTGWLIDQLLFQLERGAVRPVLIDGRDSFDPPSMTGDTGMDRHFLWVRCFHADEAVQAADWLLRDGNLPLVILDLQMNPLEEMRKIRSGSWYRLRTLAEEADTILLVFTVEKLLPCAELRFRLGHRFSLSVFD